MKRFLCIALLFSGSPLVARDIFEEFDQAVKEMHEDFQKRFDALEKYLATQRPATATTSTPAEKDTKKPAVKSIEVLPVQDNDQFVTVKLSLGELEKDKIKIEAFDKSLKGSATLKEGGSVNFYVDNGRVLGIYTKHEAKENKKSDNQIVYDSWRVAESTKEQSIPAVHNLTTTEVSYKDGILQLKMPRVPHIKGTVLNVK